MDDQYSVGVFDLSFDEDLSIYRTYGHCSSVSCYNWTCAPCDYTDPAICNGTKRPFTGINSIDCGGCVNASTPPLICRPTSLWPYVSLPPLVGNSLTFTIPKSGITIPYHPTPPDNCSSMVVKVTSLKGGASGCLMWYAATWSGNNFNDIITRWTYNVVCPTQPIPVCQRCGWGQTVILFFAPDDGVLSAEAKIEIEWRPLPYTNPNKYPKICTLPVGITSATHQCVPEAVEQNILPTVAGQAFRFVMTTRSTRSSSALCPGMLYVNSNTFRVLVSTTDPWVSSTNSSTALRRPNFMDSETTVPGIWGICIPPGASIYVWVYTTSIKNFTLLIDTNREWIIKDETNDHGQADYYKTMMGSVTINCGNKSFTQYTRSYSSVETIDTGSANVRMMFPSERANLFYPQPMFAPPSWFPLNLPTYGASQDYISRKLMISVVLSQKIQSKTDRSGKELLFPYDYQFLTETEWSTCTLRFNGIIYGNVTNESLVDNVTEFKKKIFTCNSTTYAGISARIKSIQVQIEELAKQTIVDPNKVNQLRFEQDLLITSNDFYFCEQEMLSYAILAPAVSKSAVTDLCLAPFRTQEFDNDKCCIFDPISPYAQCQSAPRNISGQYLIKEYNESKISQCPAPLCVKNSLTTLVLEKNGLQDPNRCGGSNSFQSENIDVRVYWNCLHSVFGEDPIASPGPSCVHDNDCDVISSGSICSTRTKRCLIPVEIAETSFINCIYNNLTQFTQNYIAQSFNLNVTDPNIKTLWKKAFSTNLGCSDKYSPVGYSMDALVILRCSYCQKASGIPSFVPLTFLYSPGPNFASGGQDCWDGNPECKYTAVPQPSNQFCLTPGCTTAAFLPYNLLGPGFCLGPSSFCGICEDDFYCSDVTSLIPLASCDGTSYVCVLANGTNIVTPDEITCQNIMSCTIPCTGGIACDENECINKGSCSDKTDYAISILKGYNGGCFFDLRYRAPFDTTIRTCGSFRQTILGCINYAVSQSDCLDLNFSYGDPNVIEISNVTWRISATTEAQCNAYGDYCSDDVIPSITNSYSSVYNLHPTSSCKNRKKLYKWTSGKWMGGQPRIPKITSPTYKNRWNSTAREGMDLNYIFKTITSSVNKIRTLETESHMFCETQHIAYLDELVCSCLEGKDQTLCFTNRGNVSTVGVACDESTIITTSKSTLSLVSTSVPKATCLSLFISEPSITIYQDASISDLRTLLVNYREDTSWAIRNSKNAIVAKLLTDGWAAAFDNITRIQNVTLCLILSDLRLDYQSADNFPILDVATRLVKEELTALRPADLEANVKINGQYFCVTLRGLEPNKVYHFVQRIPNWETAPRVVFSGGEIAYLSVLLALYCLGFILSTLKLGYLILMNGFEQPRLVIVLILIVLFFVFRVVLFSLLLSNSLLGVSSGRAVNYLLFEFPILLYFCFVSNYISIWLVTISVLKKFTVQQKLNIDLANMASIIFNFIIFLLFIIMIILFETIVDKPVHICDGRIVQFDEDQAFALIMSYRAIFSTIAIFIGLMLFATALVFGQLLADPYFEIPTLVRYRIYAISIIGGLGLIAQAIYFLVITATQTTPNNYVSLSILLVVEIIPALLFIFVETIKTKGSFRDRITGGSKTMQLGSIGSAQSVTNSTIN